MKRTKHSLTDRTVAQDRKHCPSCTHYLDGHQVVCEDRRVEFSPFPGTQFHRWSTGTIYQRIGVITPCVCQAGDAVEKGYWFDSMGQRTLAEMTIWQEIKKAKHGMAITNQRRLPPVKYISGRDAASGDFQRITDDDIPEINN